MIFRYLNHSCIYKSEGDAGFVKYNEYVCFREIFNKLYGYHIKQKHTLTLITDQEYIRSYNRNNYCLVDKRTVERFLRAIQLTVPTLKWKVSEGIYEEYSCFNVEVELIGNKLQHKYVLTLVRYLFEYPRNVLIRDAYLLKDMPEYKFESITNLFNLCLMVVMKNDYGLGHGISDTPMHCSNRVLTEILKKNIVNSELNRMYKPYVGLLHTVPYETEKKKLSYWTSDIEFKKRLEYYNNTYKEWIKKSM